MLTVRLGATPLMPGIIVDTKLKGEIMKSLFRIIFLLVITTNVLAYGGTPEKQVDSFFKEFSNSTDKAIDNLYASNPAMQQKLQALTLMKSQMGQVSTLYGSYLGYETISEEQLSASLVRISALAKYDVHAVTWEFYFYKPTNKWIISQATFYDQFQNIGSKK
jgi:hypothetical protein